MKIATWNVNGIRARQGQLFDWLAAEKPDIVCLQEIKASLDQLTFELRDIEGYWSYWHGEKGYSGVALLVAKSLSGALPVCSHPGFDFEQRIACGTVPTPIGDAMIASVYVPNGGKDFDAKMRFLHALESYVADAERDGKLLIVCGDLNVALEERDIHPKLRKPGLIGATPEERARRPHHLSRAGRRAPEVRRRQRQPVHLVGAVASDEGTQHRLADRLPAGIEGARRSRDVSGGAARDRQQRSRTRCRHSRYRLRQLFDQRLERLGLLFHLRMRDRDINQVQGQALAAGARVALGAVERRLRRFQLGGVGVAPQTIEVSLVAGVRRRAALLDGHLETLAILAQRRRRADEARHAARELRTRRRQLVLVDADEA
jgi:exodeoxyribonuclease III